MESFIFAISAVTPIIIMVLIGYFIKRIGLVTSDLAKHLNKIVFRVLLPCLLFLNIYKIESFSGIGGGYILFAVAAIFVIFFFAIPFSLFATKEKSRRGVLIQGVFRSNYAIVGISLAQSLFADEGLAVATLLSAVAVPVFNILAVITLSVFGDSKEKVSVKKVALGIVKNPLIIGVVAGLAALGIRALFVQWDFSFRLKDVSPIYTVLDYLSRCATPLALLTLGIQFEFSTVKELKKEIIYGTIARCVAAPVIALSIAYLCFDFTGAHFAAFVAMFATPVAVSSVPMAQEMNADVQLAGQLVVWNSIVSGFTILLYVFALKALGVF